MKKVIAFLCAAVLTLGMTVTSYAAPSVTVSGIVTEATGADKNGNAFDVIINGVSAEFADVVKEIKSEEALKKILGDAYEKGMQVVDVKSVTVPEGTEFPVTITFKVSGVTPSSTVAVLCYNIDTGEWEVVPSKAGNGTITATFTSLSSLSLVAFVVDQKTAGSMDAPGSNGSGSNSQNPATGDSAADVLPYVLIAAAALAGAGLILFSRRKRA